MNVIILSMKRCGISWLGDIIKDIYMRLYNKELKINYENDRIETTHTLLKGWNHVCDVDPKVLLQLGYDKVLIVKRDLETMKLAHAKFHGYLESYKSYEAMQQEREGFFQRIEMTHKLLYDQELNDPRVLIVRLEDLNNYTYATFTEIIEFLEFKLTFKQKIKFFLRVLKNKIKPFVIACNPTERNWDVFSALLSKGTDLCNRLQYIEKITNEVKI